MSYKDYSEEAVKEILRKVSQSTIKEQNIGPNEFTPEDPGIAVQESELHPGEIQIKDYAYNHPIPAEINRMTDTHIIIKKWFQSELSEEIIWEEIVNVLNDSFTVEAKAGEVKQSSSGKKWSHISPANHETVVRLKKTERFTSLKIIQRLGFWIPQVEGALHGSYTSLILFGIIYGMSEPSLEQSIGIFALLWTVVAMIIYKFSVSSRKEKQKHLTNFADKLTNQFMLHS